VALRTHADAEDIKMRYGVPCRPPATVGNVEVPGIGTRPRKMSRQALADVIERVLRAL